MAPYDVSKHVAVTIGTVAVGKTDGAAVIVATRAPTANGKYWSHILDTGSNKCVRDHGCGRPRTPQLVSVLLRIPQQLEEPPRRVP